jgi:hypothetical protein
MAVLSWIVVASLACATPSTALLHDSTPGLGPLRSPDTSRRDAIRKTAGLGGVLGGMFGNGNVPNARAAAAVSRRPTNEVIETVDGIRRKRLGGSDLLVSEVALGTQVRKRSASDAHKGS